MVPKVHVVKVYHMCDMEQTGCVAQNYSLFIKAAPDLFPGSKMDRVTARHQVTKGTRVAILYMYFELSFEYIKNLLHNRNGMVGTIHRGNSPAHI